MPNRPQPWAKTAESREDLPNSGCHGERVSRQKTRSVAGGHGGGKRDGVPNDLDQLLQLIPPSCFTGDLMTACS